MDNIYQSLRVLKWRINVQRKLLIASLVLNIVFIVSIAGAAIFFPRLIAGYVDQQAERWRTQFDILGERKGGIVFVGDSITEGGHWSEIFGNGAIANRGIGGNTTQNVLDRINQIYILQPAKLFLMIGINDLNQHVPVATTLANYQRIFEGFAEHLPQTKIYVQSVLPVNSKSAAGAQNKDVLSLNEFLKSESKKRGYTYVDLHSKFVDAHGELNSTLSNDGLHLLGSGYRLWRDSMKDLVSE